MSEVINRLEEMGIVPVVVIEDVQKARPLARALCNGGLPCAEVTFRTEQAVQAIREMRQECPDMLLGAGTVLNQTQVDEAILAGADFIVSPGLNPTVAEYCRAASIPVIPGINDPSGVELAMELGLQVVKFFPAQASGGVPMLKALSAPYKGIRFMPTGGINAQNIMEYLSLQSVIACGGSYMVSPQLLAENRFDLIETMTKQAVNDMLGFRIVQLCLPDLEHSPENLELENLLLTKQKAKYIKIETNNIKRAAAYFKRNKAGIKSLQENGMTLTRKYDGFTVYIQQRLDGGSK